MAPKISVKALNRLRAFAAVPENIAAMQEFVDDERRMTLEEMETAVVSANIHAAALLKGRIDAYRDFMGVLDGLSKG